mmetsp:Transcript_36659/g.105514  ORF Transcript_36659/g.105514 Transcript_36659/m.105514 type:complete len:208 (-) Transcript_36659:682-1305(-)
MAPSSINICFIPRLSCARAKPSTNSSIDNVWDWSTSSKSKKLTNSSVEASKPDCLSFFNATSLPAHRTNSLRSNKPFLSWSALRKAIRKYEQNASFCSRARFASNSFRSEVAVIRKSDTTAVNKDIIVQEPNAMKETKNNLEIGIYFVTRLAILCHESIVKMRNKVNIVVIRSPKYPFNASWSSWLILSSLRSSNLPHMWVRTIAVT